MLENKKAAWLISLLKSIQRGGWGGGIKKGAGWGVGVQL